MQPIVYFSIFFRKSSLLKCINIILKTILGKHCSYILEIVFTYFDNINRRRPPDIVKLDHVRLRIEL